MIFTFFEIPSLLGRITTQAGRQSPLNFRGEYNVENLKLSRDHHENCKTHPKEKNIFIYLLGRCPLLGRFLDTGACFASKTRLRITGEVCV